MSIRVGQLLNCVFLFAVAGGHWGVMQLVAWSNMAAVAPDGSFLAALAAEPCEQCLSIAEGREQDNEDPRSAAGAKLNLATATGTAGVPLFPPGVRFQLDDRPAPLSGICLAPPRDPPRSA